MRLTNIKIIYLWLEINVYTTLRTIFKYPLFSAEKELSWKEWWASRTPGKKFGYGIIAINVVVFACWQVPSWEPTMDKWFINNLYGKYGKYSKYGKYTLAVKCKSLPASRHTNKFLKTVVNKDFKVIPSRLLVKNTD